MIVCGEIFLYLNLSHSIFLQKHLLEMDIIVLLFFECIYLKNIKQKL